MGKYLAGLYPGFLAERFHLRPDIASVQRLSAPGDKNLAGTDAAFLCVGQQQTAQLAGEQNRSGLALAAHRYFPALDPFHCEITQFRHPDPGSADGFQNQPKPGVLLRRRQQAQILRLGQLLLLRAVNGILELQAFYLAVLPAQKIQKAAKGKPIKAKTVGQQTYMKAIGKNTVTIGVGPAGTGKTYLAVAAAVSAFRERTVNRIILTRPAVEAGERLGFLPGDLQNKVDPYLRPLYDALYDMLGAETFQKYQERGSIEVAPLAYMRGRTLDDSFIILDEAQNTTREQMKMFLTRLGFGSKIVITGDVTQIDLPDDKVSGLKDAIRVLDGVEDIAICRLTSADVVRHALVQKIINAYEKAAEKPKVSKPSNHSLYNYLCHRIGFYQSH